MRSVGWGVGGEAELRTVCFTLLYMYVLQVDNAVIVDLDNDKVTVSLEDSGLLPPLPKAAAENFKLK